MAGLILFIAGTAGIFYLGYVLYQNDREKRSTATRLGLQSTGESVFTLRDGQIQMVLNLSDKTIQATADSAHPLGDLRIQKRTIGLQNAAKPTGDFKFDIAFDVLTRRQRNLAFLNGRIRMLLLDDRFGCLVSLTAKGYCVNFSEPAAAIEWVKRIHAELRALESSGVIFPEALSDSADGVRMAAVRWLCKGSLKDKMCVELLEKCLDDNNIDIAIQASMKLRSRAVPRLINRFGHASSHGKRKILMRLGRIRGQKATGFLLKCLRSSDQEVASRASLALASASSQEAVEPMLERLQELTIASSRAVTLRALSKYSEPRVMEQMTLTLTTDPAARCRRVAAAYLIGNGTREQLELILRGLEVERSIKVKAELIKARDLIRKRATTRHLGLISIAESDSGLISPVKTDPDRPPLD